MPTPLVFGFIVGALLAYIAATVPTGPAWALHLARCVPNRTPFGSFSRHVGKIGFSAP